jgi:ADP-ribose pyrophosphatase
VSGPDTPHDAVAAVVAGATPGGPGEDAEARAAAQTYPVRARLQRFHGTMFDLLTDEVEMPGGQQANRDYLVHPGAVGAVAVDDQDRIVLVRQYRHPAGQRMWELPAGLIDVEGEELVHAAARELAEESDLTARHWQLLADAHTTPGSSNEIIRLFLARGLEPVPEQSRYERRDEEAGLVTTLVDLDRAVAMVLAGEITNAACAIGVLGAARLRDQGWPTGVRPLDAPLPRRPLAPVEGE